jgi:integrase
VQKHVLPHLGARRLRDLTATEVDAWLAILATSLSTRTLQGVRACLNRAVRRAMARDKVKRNVVELTEVPAGVPGRPSKAMTAQQADDVIIKTASDPMHPYMVVSLLTGARTEELRALRWEHSFVSLLSDAGVPIEDVSRLVGHSSTSVTELIYRHQIRPVIQSGATIMDRLFGSPGGRRAADAVAARDGIKSPRRQPLS